MFKFGLIASICSKLVFKLWISAVRASILEFAFENTSDFSISFLRCSLFFLTFIARSYASTSKIIFSLVRLLILTVSCLMDSFIPFVSNALLTKNWSRWIWDFTGSSGLLTSRLICLISSVARSLNFELWHNILIKVGQHLWYNWVSLTLSLINL